MLADLIKKAAKGLPRVAPSAKTLAFLKTHRVPLPIVEALKACSVSTSIQVGRLVLGSFAELPTLNAKPSHHAIRNGFLIIGFGASGDPIAVELSNGQVAFISHELLWDFDPDCSHFDELVARSTLDLDAFWGHAASNKDFPVDFYAARGE